MAINIPEWFFQSIPRRLQEEIPTVTRLENSPKHHPACTAVMTVSDLHIHHPFCRGTRERWRQCPAVLTLAPSPTTHVNKVSMSLAWVAYLLTRLQ